MISHFRAQLILVAGTVLLCCIGYPLLLFLIGMGLFPSQAAGSLLTDAKGTVIGSRLIAQPFKGDEWFQPRPSAVDYNAAGSGGSNLGANNPKLRERVVAALKTLQSTGTIPADAVTASGSGLDPHITLANAQLQMKRIAQAWARKTQQQESQTEAIIDKLLKEHAYEPMFGLAGCPPLVKVLELNLVLQKSFAEQR
ncbi:MAG: potassium-transporting ATPase subunit C [Planctomycetia bacterium]|nr:potassium-transporting ATPase subunit C [Planctomycetia bacterium]